MGDPQDVQQMLQDAHEMVQNEFDVRAAFGQSGGDIIHLFALRGSHHEIPWVCS